MNLQAYRKEVWLLMHNSYDPNTEIAAVRLYLDESGGDDPGTPHAIVGGMIINRSHFEHFEEVWNPMLIKNGIEPPLHMKEFGAHGRFAKVSYSSRKELFTEVAELINTHKIFSIDASLSNAEYQAHISQQIRDHYSVYAMCFNLAVALNHKLAEQNSYREKIAFILDTGNPYSGHVVAAHAVMSRLQKEGAFLHVGTLAFGDDELLGVLQAADVIAWGARRRATWIPLDRGFEPISSILDSKDHAHASWDTSLLKELADGLTRRIQEEEERNAK